MKTNCRFLTKLLALATLCLFIVCCNLAGQPSTKDPPLSPISPLPFDSISPQAIKLPAGETIAEFWKGDLDEDGPDDVLALTERNEKMVLTLYRYEVAKNDQLTQIQNMELPENGLFHELTVTDVNFDGLLDIGVQLAKPKTGNFVLFLYMNQGNSLKPHSPQGGHLDGQIGFTSIIAPAVIGDIDREGNQEIVVFIEGSNPEYLATRAYTWDGTQMIFADYLYIPGRKRP
jgi:hypothetical protein